MWQKPAIFAIPVALQKRQFADVLRYPALIIHHRKSIRRECVIRKFAEKHLL
ncbi:MAG: hypothetical protein R3C41_03830 [Calditrichia bacterium]|nr:hypothetical protein [Calditrichia bacterium]